MAAPKKRRDAERELKKKGFAPVKGRGKGSHEVWQDPSGKSVVVPKHGDEIAAGTWRSIEKQAQAPARDTQAAADTDAAQRLANGGQRRAGSGTGQEGQGQRGQQGGQQAAPKKKGIFRRS
ncbi:type II toxin-antitoxin system HicA family toxin [Kribbella sp. NPDC055071]